LAELRAAGVRVWLRNAGTVALDAAARPSVALLNQARAYRGGITALLQDEGKPSSSDHVSLRANQAVVPDAWIKGVSQLAAKNPPPGFSVQRWTRACQDATGLLYMHGAELLALGWTATDAFGLHATAPGPAVDCYGLAMLMDGGTVTELTAEGARIVRPSGAELRMRRGAGRPSVPAWELDQGPAE